MYDNKTVMRGVGSDGQLPGSVGAKLTSDPSSSLVLIRSGRLTITGV